MATRVQIERKLAQDFVGVLIPVVDQRREIALGIKTKGTFIISIFEGDLAPPNGPLWKSRYILCVYHVVVRSTTASAALQPAENRAGRHHRHRYILCDITKSGADDGDRHPVSHHVRGRSRRRCE